MASSWPETATHLHWPPLVWTLSSLSHCSTRTCWTPEPPMWGMDTTTGFLRWAVRCWGPTMTTGVIRTSPVSSVGLSWLPATTHTQMSSVLPGSIAPCGTVRDTEDRGIVILVPTSPTRVQVTCCWSAHRGSPRLAGTGPPGPGLVLPPSLVLPSEAAGEVLGWNTRMGCS